MTTVAKPIIFLAFANDRDDRARYLRNLADEEWRRHFQGEPYRPTCSQWPRGRRNSMILVTGGSGLSGSYVIRELKGRGHAVRALERTTSADMISRAGAEIAIGNLTDPDSLRRACQGVNGIVHAACTFTDSRIDIAAMQGLLDGWRDGPFVYFSSLDVYGYAATPLITEDEPLNESHNDYARGKVFSERLLVEAARRQGRTDTSILRAPHIWAPHPTAYRRLIGLLGTEHSRSPRRRDCLVPVSGCLD